MSMYIKEMVSIIDQYLTEFRTSPESPDHSETQSLLYFVKTAPESLIEEIERFMFYDKDMRFWLNDNKGAEASELSEEILSVFIRYQWPSLTYDSLEKLKISLDAEKYIFVENEIKRLIKLL